MNRIDILEAMYEALEDSTEWAIGSKDDSYTYFVDGILAMTDVMLEKEKEIHKRMIEGLKNSGMIGAIDDLESNVEFNE